MPDDKVPTSSIVMRAIDAKTFTELQEFTKDLESRPVDRLLADVAELVKPSESKAQIVGYVIAMKFRKSNPDERRRIAESLESTLKQLEAGEQRDRVAAVLDRITKREM